MAETVSNTCVSGNFRTNSTDAQHYALMEGVGIAQVPSFLIGGEIASGRLEVIFRDAARSKRCTPAIKAYYPSARLRLPKIKLFVDFLMNSLRGRHQGQKEQTVK